MKENINVLDEINKGTCMGIDAKLNFIKGMRKEYKVKERNDSVV